jgi:creatinine amidohydrolase
VLVELGRSAREWVGRLLVVNGHGGNAPAVAAAVRRLRYEGDDAAWLPCSVPGGDAHAGRTETSLMLALDPDAVALPRAVAGDPRPVASILDELRRSGVAGVSPTGVLGDPAGADAEEGARMLDGMVRAATAAARRWDVRDDGRLRLPAQTGSRPDRRADEEVDA